MASFSPTTFAESQVICDSLSITLARFVTHAHTSSQLWERVVVVAQRNAVLVKCEGLTHSGRRSVSIKCQRSVRCFFIVHKSFLSWGTHTHSIPRKKILDIGTCFELISVFISCIAKGREKSSIEDYHNSTIFLHLQHSFLGQVCSVQGGVTWVFS